MKVLIYSNRKSDTTIWDASTPEKQAAAFMALFVLLKDEYEVYDELESAPDGEFTKTERKQRELYAQAITGNAAATELLLRARRTYEYEEWSLGEVLNPTTVHV